MGYVDKVREGEARHILSTYHIDVAALADVKYSFVGAQSDQKY